MNAPVPPEPPSREQLQASLRALHAELARTARVDASSHRLLQQLLHDMQRLLHTTEKSADSDAAHGKGDGDRDDAPPTQRLQGLAVLFEAEHPRLAGSLRQFVELCSRAGL